MIIGKISNDGWNTWRVVSAGTDHDRVGRATAELMGWGEAAGLEEKNYTKEEGFDKYRANVCLECTYLGVSEALLEHVIVSWENSLSPMDAAVEWWQAIKEAA